MNPAETPANTAAMPASGERPTDMYSAAASGGSTMYPASIPIELMIPRKTIAGVKNRWGTTFMKPLSRAPIIPVFSATPIPSMPVSTTPSGANPMKLLTMLSNAQKRPEAVSRLTGRIVESWASSPTSTRRASASAPSRRGEAAQPSLGAAVEARRISRLSETSSITGLPSSSVWRSTMGQPVCSSRTASPAASSRMS